MTSHLRAPPECRKRRQAEAGPALALLRPAEGAAVTEVKWWEKEARRGLAQESEGPRKGKVLIIP